MEQTVIVTTQEDLVRIISRAVRSVVPEIQKGRRRPHSGAGGAGQKILEAVVTALSAHRDTAGRNRPQPRRTVRAAAPECRIGAPQRALFLCPSSNPARRRFASLASSPGMFFLLQHAAPHLLSF